MYGFFSGPSYKLSTGEIKFPMRKSWKFLSINIGFFLTEDGIDRGFETFEAYRALYFSWINNLPHVKIITIASLIIFLYFEKYIL